jgi:hypothetical protein
MTDHTSTNGTQSGPGPETVTGTSPLRSMPPDGAPTWFDPPERPPRPDVRVWPPSGQADRPDPAEPSTAPFPALGGSLPLPPHYRNPWTTSEQPLPASPPEERRSGDGRRRGRGHRRKRRMSRPMKIGVQLFAGAGLVTALLGVKGYDALHRYEMRSPAITVEHAAVGQDVTMDNARWRLTALAPMAHPPEESRPGRVWMEADITVTALNEKGTKFDFSTPGFEIVDGPDYAWRGEKLSGPNEMTVGVPATFKVIGVVPKARVDRVSLVLWPEGIWDSGSAIHFDR